jgi:YidC/Oxa1 family membrane protein insertase
VSFLNPLFEAVAWVMMRIQAGLAVPFGETSGVTWALSIIILVVLMRLVMVPLFIKQRNSMLKMQSHMPQLQELRKRYKNDKTRLNEETMKFYKENGINPLGGCLPLVAQLPVFWSLFNVLKAIARWTPGTTPQYGLTTDFVKHASEAKIFGIKLVDQFLHPVAGESTTSRLLIVIFVLASAVTTFLTMRQSQKRGMMNQSTPDPDAPGAAMAQSMSKNMMYIAPFFALTGLYWQFGLVLYWVTTNVWTLGQQHFLFRRLPVVGSATVGASAAPVASGPAAKGTAARTAKPGGSGTAARPGTTAKPGTVAKAGSARQGAAAAKPGTKAVPARPATKATAARPAAPKTSAKAATASSPVAKAPVDDTVDTVPSAKVNGNGNGAANGDANGSSVLRRFSRAKAEQPEEPEVPQTKIVRQQPVRQTRSKRGNTGKR